jgi:hypothetical protein
MTTEQQIGATPSETFPATSHPFDLFIAKPVELKIIPHLYGETKMSVQIGSTMRLVSVDPKREWVNVKVSSPQNSAVFGWINGQVLRTQLSSNAVLLLAKLPVTDYANNSRQDILVLIAAIYKQAVSDFQASGRRRRATGWMLTIALLATFVGSAGSADLGLAALFSSVFSLIVWLCWVAHIWHDYNPAQILEQLQKVQKSKRNVVEVLEDGVKAATQVAVGGVLVIGALALLTAQSKQRPQKVLPSRAPHSLAASVFAAQQAQQIERLAVERAQQAERRRTLAMQQAAEKEKERQLQRESLSAELDRIAQMQRIKQKEDEYNYNMQIDREIRAHRMQP